MVVVIFTPYPSQAAPVVVSGVSDSVIVRVVEIAGLNMGIIGMVVLVLGIAAINVLARERA